MSCFSCNAYRCILLKGLSNRCPQQLVRREFRSYATFTRVRERMATAVVSFLFSLSLSTATSCEMKRLLITTVGSRGGVIQGSAVIWRRFWQIYDDRLTSPERKCLKILPVLCLKVLQTFLEMSHSSKLFVEWLLPQSADTFRGCNFGCNFSTVRVPCTWLV